MAPSWFKRGDRADELTVDELVILGRLDDAEAKLERRLKENPEDRHARARLGDVLTLQGRKEHALDHYLYAADAYRDDGFLDKAAAVLSKALKIAPEDGGVKIRIAEVEDSRRLEHMRDEALEGMREGMTARGSTATLEHAVIWRRIADSDFPRRIDPHQVRRIFSQVEIVKLDTGEVLHRRGDRDAELFIVGPGEIEVLLDSPKGRIDLTVYSNGDVFGENALLQQTPWRALYRATKKTTLLRLPRAGFEQALQGNPDPRSLIESLRAQNNDSILEENIAQLRLA